MGHSELRLACGVGMDLTVRVALDSAALSSSWMWKTSHLVRPLWAVLMGGSDAHPSDVAWRGRYRHVCTWQTPEFTLLLNALNLLGWCHLFRVIFWLNLNICSSTTM